MQSSWSLKCSHISARKLTLCFIPYCFYCIKILHPLWIMNSSFVDTADAMGGRLIHPEKNVWLGAKSASFFGNEKLGDHQDSSQNLESRAIKKNRIISYVFRLFLNDVSKLSMKMLQMHPPAFWNKWESRIDGLLTNKQLFFCTQTFYYFTYSINLALHILTMAFKT